MEEIEMVDIPASLYVRFGDFEDVILPSIGTYDECGEDDDDEMEEGEAKRYIGEGLWSAIIGY